MEATIDVLESGNASWPACLLGGYSANQGRGFAARWGDQGGEGGACREQVERGQSGRRSSSEDWGSRGSNPIVVCRHF